MPQAVVTFLPVNITVTVPAGTTLLAAAAEAGVAADNLCGGEGLCGRCRVKVETGTVEFTLTGNITQREVDEGYVLACLARVTGDCTVLLPGHMVRQGHAAGERFSERGTAAPVAGSDAVIKKTYLALEAPGLDAPVADAALVRREAGKALGIKKVVMDFGLLRELPGRLRRNGFKVTAVVYLDGGAGTVIGLEDGDTAAACYGIVYDLGTTTIAAHLVNTADGTTAAAAACFSAQAAFGREVTGRIISAEKNGTEPLRQSMLDDMNRLAGELCDAAGIRPEEIYAAVCAGNTPVCHFLLGLPADAIRRTPYVPVTASYPVLTAAEAGLSLVAGARLMTVPGISGWVGGDITAGIAATDVTQRKDLTLFIDIGTNGEVVLGNDDWLVATSASAGPALEGASVACGMRAEEGAVETVREEDGGIVYGTIGNAPARGICGSGILDLLAVLVRRGICDRSGSLQTGMTGAVVEENGIKKFILEKADPAAGTPEISLSEKDIENIKTAKAAIYAALKILLVRLDLTVDAVDRFVIAGAFGKHLNLENAVSIGLLPPVPAGKVVFAGNTSLYGAKAALLDRGTRERFSSIAANATYYDLMGADDYVDQFQQAMFLPHTNIEEFA